MPYSIDYHLITFQFEQGAIVTYSKSVFRSGVGQVFDIAGQIIAHCFDLFDDAMRVAPVNGFQVFQRPGMGFSTREHT